MSAFQNISEIFTLSARVRLPHLPRISARARADERHPTRFRIFPLRQINAPSAAESGSFISFLQFPNRRMQQYMQSRSVAVTA